MTESEKIISHLHFPRSYFSDVYFVFELQSLNKKNPKHQPNKNGNKITWCVHLCKAATGIEYVLDQKGTYHRALLCRDCWKAKNIG